jgi:hypothetical protein
MALTLSIHHKKSLEGWKRAPQEFRAFLQLER